MTKSTTQERMLFFLMLLVQWRSSGELIETSQGPRFRPFGAAALLTQGSWFSAVGEGSTEHHAMFPKCYLAHSVGKTSHVAMPDFKGECLEGQDTWKSSTRDVPTNFIKYFSPHGHISIYVLVPSRKTWRNEST